MSNLFKNDDDLGYLDDSVHINWKKVLPAVIIIAAAVIALVITLIISFGHKGKKVTANVTSTEETSSAISTDADGNNTLRDNEEKEQDPQYSDDDGSMNQSSENGASVILSNSTNETSDVTIGVDVSKFQGTINTSENRQKSMTKAERTAVATAFLQEIYNRGYTPMFYAASSELTNNNQWNTASLESSFKMWVAQYPSTTYPQTASTSYTGTCNMWQYTNQGRVAGIGTNVDINVAYFGFSESSSSLSGETAAAAAPDVEAGMTFTSVNDTVTAKDEVRLRDKPSQDTDSSVIATLTNGETVSRTGTSSSGWSRLTYNGQTVYAVTSYLTTDLTPKATENPTTGFNTKFTDCNDTVTPKDEINLRNKPSVTDLDSVVVATVKNGETFTRTGYNTELGWSRVIYNGQTLYCVTSYLNIQ